MSVNLSTAYGMNLTISSLETTQIHVRDILDSFCKQIDAHVITCVILIFLFWLMLKVIAPMSERGLNSILPQFMEQWRMFFEMFESLTETVALMSSCYIVGLTYYQGGLSNYHYIMLGVIGFLLVGAIIIKIIDWNSGGRRNVIKDDIIEVKETIEKYIEKK